MIVSQLDISSLIQMLKPHISFRWRLTQNENFGVYPLSHQFKRNSQYAFKCMLCLEYCHSFTLPSDNHFQWELNWKWKSMRLSKPPDSKKAKDSNFTLQNTGLAVIWCSDSQNTQNNINELTDRSSSRPATPIFCKVKLTFLSMESGGVAEICSTFSSVPIGHGCLMAR